MNHSNESLLEMKVDREDSIKDLKIMLANNQIGGYRSIEEVKHALAFEENELNQIVKALKKFI